MRHFNCLAAILTVAAAACTRQENPSSQVLPTADGDARITLSQVLPETKTVSTYTEMLANENKVNDFQLFAFDSDGTAPGSLTSYYHSAEAGATSWTTSLHRGKKRLLALANCNAIAPSQFSGWSQASGVVCDSKTSITSAALPMSVGMWSPWEMTVAAGENRNVPIEFIHMVSRITLKSLKNEVHPDLGTNPKGKMIALLNVPKGMRADGTVLETPVYNPLGQDFSTEANCAASGGAFTYRALSYTGSTLNKTCVYVFPGSNVYLLVGVEFTKDSATKTYYYAVPLKGLAYNHTYDLDLTLRNIGSENPANPAITEPSSFTFTVKPWDPAEAITELM